VRETEGNEMIRKDSSTITIEMSDELVKRIGEFIAGGNFQDITNRDQAINYFVRAAMEGQDGTSLTLERG
jgi:hypothetical protein